MDALGFKEPGVSGSPPGTTPTTSQPAPVTPPLQQTANAIKAEPQKPQSVGAGDTQRDWASWHEIQVKLPQPEAYKNVEDLTDSEKIQYNQWRQLSTKVETPTAGKDL